MSEFTENQSHEEQQRARKLSLDRTNPPTEVPGYEIQRFLGSGAYGEVWVGVDRTTGRQVAIKFYSHRGGVDWSLLSREVDKLVRMSADRYVVQLLDVGWDANPPFYVMEYIKHGSLEDLLVREGTLPIDEALDMFDELCVALMHAHSKGVLHCDLKPANVLLDEDRKPRLADFGQSRMSHEQTPALGTLFFMAPEQADLKAMPDAKWDVYALGALFYTLLVGNPPHRSGDSVREFESDAGLEDRLARYRKMITSASPPARHRKVAGVDRRLAEIVERCIAPNPLDRFASIESVLDALRAREQARTRRPLVMLGFVGPLVLLFIMTLFGIRGYRQTLHESEIAVTSQASESNQDFVEFVAWRAAYRLDRYRTAVRQFARSEELPRLMSEVTDSATFKELTYPEDASERTTADTASREAFVEWTANHKLQAMLEQWFHDPQKPSADSWFVCNASGIQLAAEFRNRQARRNVVGRNYAWRSYFTGEPDDRVQATFVSRAGLKRADVHIEETHISTPFVSTATGLWKVAISEPIVADGQFLGIVALTFNIDEFISFDRIREDRFAVLVDARDSQNKGRILWHPIFNQVRNGSGKKLPSRIANQTIANVEQYTGTSGRLYKDPMARQSEGAVFDKHWIVAAAPVMLERRRVAEETGLVVLVQENADAVITPIRNLGSTLLREGVMALVVVLLVVVALWFIVVRVLRGSDGSGRQRLYGSPRRSSIHSMETIAAPSGKKQD